MIFRQIDAETEERKQNDQVRIIWSSTPRLEGTGDPAVIRRSVTCCLSQIILE